MNNIAIYSNGEIELKISVDEETIWLTQKQIAELFDKDVRTINEHIKGIYQEEELFENSTIRNFRIVQKEGKREVIRDISHYNLDVIISIGYRANSKKATKFRQWATSVLKEYIVNGYVFINDLLRDAKQEITLIDNYNKQYENLIMKISNKYHDRFLIIDNKIVYHLGASFKDLGKKVFAFSKMDIDVLNIMEKLR